MAWWALILLAIFYILSFVDRFILALLIEPIQSRFQVDDGQMGLLFGTAFAVFYAVVGLPLARYADTGNRMLLLVAGVVVWSLSTSLSAFAGSFAILLLLRIGLAVGEATLTPTAYSLIGDLFPPEKRILAASIYSAAGMTGAGGAYLLGGSIISLVANNAGFLSSIGLDQWQFVLLIVGFPGILLIMLFALTVRLPKRGTLPRSQQASIKEVCQYFVRERRLFVGLFFGAGLTQAVSYTAFAWVPELLRREHGWEIQDAGLLMGGATIGAGFAGTLLLPQISRALENQGVGGAYGKVSLAALIVGTVLATAAMFQTQGTMLILLLGLGLLFNIGATNNIVVSTQSLVPQNKRALAVAILLLCITALGLGLGPYCAAAIAGLMPDDPHQLSHAIAITFVISTMLAAAFFVTSRKRKDDYPPPEDLQAQ